MRTVPERRESSVPRPHTRPLSLTCSMAQWAWQCAVPRPAVGQWRVAGNAHCTHRHTAVAPYSTGTRHSNRRCTVQPLARSREVAMEVAGSARAQRPSAHHSSLARRGTTSQLYSGPAVGASAGAALSHTPSTGHSTPSSTLSSAVPWYTTCIYDMIYEPR